MSTPDGTALAHADATVPNRILDVGDIVSGSFRTLRANPALFLAVPVGLGLVLVVPVFLFVVVAARSDSGDGASGGTVAALVLGFVVLALAALYLFTRLLVAVTLGAYRIALGERPTVGQVWRESSGGVLRLFGTAGVLILAAIAVSLLIAVLFVALAATDSGIAVGIAAAIVILGLLPACIYVAVRLVLIVPVVAVERAGPTGAIRRSFSLTQGQWWRTFGRYLLLQVLYLPVQALAGAFAPSPSSQSGDFEIGLGLVSLMAGVVFIVLALAYAAYSQIYVTLMYLDARRREDWRSAAVVARPGPPYPYGQAATDQSSADGVPPSSPPYGPQSGGPQPAPYPGQYPYPQPPSPASPPPETTVPRPGDDPSSSDRGSARP